MPVAKLYYVRYGEAILPIEGEERAIREGDVVFTSAHARPTLRNESDCDFSPFAIGWTPMDEAREESQ